MCVLKSRQTPASEMTSSDKPPASRMMMIIDVNVNARASAFARVLQPGAQDSEAAISPWKKNPSHHITSPAREDMNVQCLMCLCARESPLRTSCGWCRVQHHV